MSWPYVAAAWRLPLDPNTKLTALALADQASALGIVQASNTTLRTLTGQSEQTVRRSLRALQARQLAHLLEVATPRSSARYELRYTGASLVGGAILAPGANGRDQGCQIESTQYSSLIPKSRKAEAPGRRLETPTRDQVTKLAHTLIDDPIVQIEEPGDLEALLKRACAQAGFRYDAAIVDDGINRALAARGIDPKQWDARHLWRSRQTRAQS